MMRSIKKKIGMLYLVTLLILVSSCETDVTGDINLAESPPRLVINGGLERNSNNPLDVQKFRLTTTVGFLSPESAVPFVEDALVSITDGTTSWDFVHAGDGFYENTNLSPEIGTTYTITIIWNGDTYEGSDTLNEAPIIERIFSEFQEETIFENEGFVLKIDTTDPLDFINFYYYRVFRNGEFIIAPDVGNSRTLIISDEFFNGQQRKGVGPNEEVIFQPGDVGIAQQLSISEGYFDYLFQLFEQTGNQGPSFGGNPPPASIRSNIINTTNSTNKILGYFYTVDVAEDSITITQ